ncbi:MAG: dihydroorotase [Ruminococcaceae bacterium]|nr:dihydroorotase [Oscillospiraceae bacterium]
MKGCQVQSVMIGESATRSAVNCLTQQGFLSVPKTKYVILPGFCDVHVHLREPGFSYKETVRSGTAAAARGGYTTVFSMPNLNPVPDSPQTLEPQLELIRRDALVEVLPYGSITKGEAGLELSDMEGLAPLVCGFSDDGRGVQKDDVMRDAMRRARALGKPIVAHCEVNELLRGGYIHDGDYARAHGHRGICSESEYLQIERDLRLVREIGCAYHVCHISTKESVELIRRAKAEGLDVTCETGPHYLILSDRDLREEGRFKMNPPLRGEADRLALLEGIADGTVDMIATDHAPHGAEEKSKGLEKSPFGIVGLETAFPLLYTELVEKGVLSLERLMELMVFHPRKRFGLSVRENDYTVFEVSREYEIDPAEFLSMGRSTPFEGRRVLGTCVLTVCNGRIVYQKRK